MSGITVYAAPAAFRLGWHGSQVWCLGDWPARRLLLGPAGRKALPGSFWTEGLPINPERFAARQEGNVLGLFDLASLEQLCSWPCQRGPARLKASPDGRWLVHVFEGRATNVHRADTGEVVHETFAADWIDFTPDSRRLVLATRVKLDVLDLASGRRHSPPETTVTSAPLVIDNEHFVALDGAGDLARFDLESGEKLLLGGREAPEVASPTIAGSRGHDRIYSTATSNGGYRCSGMLCLAVSPDGAWLAVQRNRGPRACLERSGAEDREGRWRFQLPCQPKRGIELSFSSDSQQLACLVCHHHLYLFSLRDNWAEPAPPAPVYGSMGGTLAVLPPASPSRSQPWLARLETYPCRGEHDTVHCTPAEAIANLRQRADALRELRSRPSTGRDEMKKIEREYAALMGLEKFSALIEAGPPPYPADAAGWRAALTAWFDVCDDPAFRCQAFPLSEVLSRGRADYVYAFSISLSHRPGSIIVATCLPEVHQANPDLPVAAPFPLPEGLRVLRLYIDDQVQYSDFEVPYWIAEEFRDRLALTASQTRQLLAVLQERRFEVARTLALYRGRRRHYVLQVLCTLVGRLALDQSHQLGWFLRRRLKRVFRLDRKLARCGRCHYTDEKSAFQKLYICDYCWSG
ncbi:MAG: hypothetical protein KC910_16460 [Candidatus Eremiobacteraeota bacterium]|nr:hypothetical protein [Candidatus Eremiobacteraeota bacterium]